MGRIRALADGAQRRNPGGGRATSHESFSGVDLNPNFQVFVAALAAEDPLELVTVVYDTVSAPLTDNEDGYVTVLTWSDALGTPQVRNEVDVGIEEHTPAFENGAITIKPDVDGPLFIRGDTNGDLLLDISDPTYLLSHLFQNGDAPVPPAAGDVNDDGALDVADAVYELDYLFSNGPPPPPPFPDLGCGD